MYPRKQKDKALPRMLKAYLFISFLCLLAPAVSSAGGTGTSSMYSMLHPYSARAAALSGACVSLQGNLSLMQYNPASLLTISDYNLSFSYQGGRAGESYLNALFGLALENSSVGGGIQLYDTGDISIYDLYGYEVTKTGQRDVIFIIGSAQDFDFITAGMNLKLYFSEIFGENAFGFASDIGAMYRINEKINTGFSIQNLGTPANYLDKEEPLPLVMRSGASYESRIDTIDYVLSVDIPYHVNERYLFLNMGMEIMLHKLLTFRSGAEVALGAENKTDGFLTIGWSFGTESIRLDYAVKVTENLDIPHFITTEVKF